MNGERALVVATYRSNELDRLSPAFQTVDEGAAERLELPPLHRDHVSEVARLALKGLRLSETFLNRLYDITQGNAFFVMESLRHLVESGFLLRSGGQWSVQGDLGTVPLPSSIQQVVQARLATLIPAHREVLLRLAVVGRVLELSLLREVGGLDERALFDVLDVSVERQFLQYSEGRYFFIHDTVRESLYKSSDSETLKANHHRVATALEASSGGDAGAARAIGHHFARSTEPARAIPHLVKAADVALSRKAALEGTLLMKEAAGLLETQPSSRERDSLWATLAGKLVEVGFSAHPPTCLEYCAKLFNEWEKLPLQEGADEWQGQLKKAESATLDSRRKIMATIVREIPVQSSMKPLDAFTKRAEFRIMQAVGFAALNRVDDLGKLRTVTLVEQPRPSPYRAAEVLGNGIFGAHRGRFGLMPEILELLDELRGYRAELKTFPRRLTWSLALNGYLANLYRGLSAQPLDSATTQEGLSLASEFGFMDIQIHHMNTQLTYAAASADPRLFEPAFRQVGDLVRQMGNPRLLESRSTVFLPIYYAQRQELELAKALRDRLKKLSFYVPMDGWLKFYVQFIEAIVASFERTDATTQQLEETARVAEQLDSRYLCYALCMLSEHHLSRGNLESARVAADRAWNRATAPEYANTFDKILAARSQAGVAADDRKDELLRQALGSAEKLQLPFHQGILHFQLAEATLATARAQAAVHLDQAQAFLEQVRATTWLDRIRGFRERAARSV